MQEIEEIGLLTTLGSVKDAVKWLSKYPQAYDLVFMDIRLSDALSFEIFGQVSVNSPVIFVTAYDEYALKAFKTNGIDYILKPFDRSGLEQALNKFRQLSPISPVGPALLRQLAEQLRTMYTGFRQSFLIHHRDKLIPLATKNIAWIQSINEVSHAQTFDNKKFIVDFTLELLEEQLEPQDFFRANRQFIVQRNAITEVGFYFNSRLLLKVQPPAGENILFSKARVPELKEWMNR